jgi:hypothetical protein
MRRLALFVAPVAALGGLVATGTHAGAVVATTRYVSTTGLDANPCTLALPCHTLQHAVDIANAGDTVKVQPGTYNQTVNITKPLTLQGSGASSTTIDGSNIDTGTPGGGTGGAQPAYFGVVSVQNNPNTGGPIGIRGLTIDHAFVTPAESAAFDDPSDVSVYADANAADTVSVSGVVLGAVQNPADMGGIGFDTFNDAATVTFTNSTSKGNFQGALLEGGGLGTALGVTVSHVHFTQLTPCAGLCSGGGTFPPEGLFVLSDQPGTAVATISYNTFNGYAGDGLDATAGYSGGNCTPTACTGNVKLIANGNSFTLGGATGAAGIFIASESGNLMTANLSHNHGSVGVPSTDIIIDGDGGLLDVTEHGNNIS